MIVRALVFSDVVDSTQIAERLGEATAAQLWLEHDRRVRELLERYDGREMARADGLFALFENAVDAARYAFSLHDVLKGLPLRVRVGLHVGPVTLHDNTPADIQRGASPMQVEGFATPITSRLMSLAGAGQSLLSRAARDAIVDAVPDGALIASHGHYRLKGVEEPVEVFELGRPNSSPLAPPADADKAHRVVRVGDLWMPVRQIRHNIPGERDGFVGRSADLHRLAGRFDKGARLITVLGPGGTGKTRYVRRYARKWLGDWPGGIYFADLSEARSPDGIYFAVAGALEVPLGGGDAAAHIGHAIANLGRCLVILDNFEQIAQHADETLGRWLDASSEAGFLVTSRERLGLPGEDIFALEPLPLETEAAELFEMRARSQRPDFALDAANRGAVREIVRLLDGLPLAIELAAARINVLGPDQLLERLSDRFAVLSRGRASESRQATLRQTIDWSWNLLAPWEQAAFAQCYVFEGGISVAAAEAVLDISAWKRAPPIVDVVQALYDKSLLRIWTSDGGRGQTVDQPYLAMYLSMREYAAARLAMTPIEARRVEERHGEFFARFGDDDAIEALWRVGGVLRRRVLALEIDNLIVAFHRAVARDDGAIAVALLSAVWGAVELQGPYDLVVGLAGDVLTLPSLDKPQRARALFMRGSALRRIARADEAAATLECAVQLAREIGDRQSEADALIRLGNVRRHQRLMEESRRHLEGALSTAQAVGNRRIEGMVLSSLAGYYAEGDELASARSFLERALELDREMGNVYSEGSNVNNLASICRLEGKLDEAAKLYERALAMFREVGNRRDEAQAVLNLGLLREDQNRPGEAFLLYKEALHIAREVGDREIEGKILRDGGSVLRRDESKRGGE